MAERKDHAQIAQNNLDWVGGRELTTDAAAVTVAAAQVHATLALVEQQRIANIIALGQVRIGAMDLPAFRHFVSEPVGEYGVRPTATIREGLGL